MEQTRLGFGWERRLRGGEDAGVWTLVFGRWPAYGPLVLSGPTGSAYVSVFFFWVLVGGAWGTSGLM